MKLYSHPVIFGVKEDGFQIISDFMIPFVILHNDSEKTVHLNGLSFQANSLDGCILQQNIDTPALASRFRSAVAEWKLYRPITWERTLGISEPFPLDTLAVGDILLPGQRAVLHQESFRIHSPSPVHEVVVKLHWDGGMAGQTLHIDLESQKNKYRFPIRKPCFVTGCYIDTDAHRWCRNSEFAIDIGLPAPSGRLDPNAIGGEPVYAAADGVILRAAGCVQEDETDPGYLERQYGNDVRIDGNHVILEHAEGECSLYAHLQRLSKPWKCGDPVRCGELLGYAGSTGNSSCPHLHFHVFKKQGAFGPSIPIVFYDLLDIYGDPLDRAIRDDSLVFPQDL